MENNENANGALLKTKSEFDISDSALGTLMFIVMTILFSIVLSLSGIKVKMSSFAYYVLHIVVEGLFAVAAFIVSKMKKKNLFEAAGMKKKINGNIVGWCFLIAFVSLLGFSNLTNVFIEILQCFGFSTAGANIEINNFWQYVGMVVASCVTAAFCEELLFRGVIESGFKKWGIKVAVGFSALIFMIMHGSALQTIHQFIIGVVIGYVFFKTGNLWIGVLIHFFNNLIPVTEVYLLSIIEKAGTAPELTAETTTTTAGFGSILINFIVALIMAWAGYYLLRILFKKVLQEDEKLNGEKPADDVVTSIKVDGEDKEVEMSIDGVPAESQEEPTLLKEEKPNISGGTIAMFSIAGLYLVVEWIINTISRFM